MKLIIISITGMMLWHSPMAQGFISMKRTAIRNQLTAFYDKHKTIIRFEETDSTLTCFLMDSSGSTSRSFTYFFKDNNRCFKETAKGDCEACFSKLFNDAKLVKRYQWKKISDLLYISKPLWNLTLLRETGDPSFSYTIVKNYFDRTAHTKLYKSSL